MSPSALVLFTLLALLAHTADGRYFAQFSDVHLDWSYHEGSPTSCLAHSLTSLPCCHKTDVGHGHASPLGSFRCDTPPALIHESMKALRGSYPNVDMVLFSGDSVSHEILTETNSHVYRAMREIWNATAENFPDVPLYPALGNHDMWPLYNIADKDGLRHLEKVNEIWSRWVSPEQCQKTVRKGAFYTMNVAPGVRLVVLNSMYYAVKNLLVHSKYDPQGQEAWAQSVLEEAKVKGEAVWIMLHVPAADGDLRDSFNEWYASLVANYSSVIKAQFAGHTHFDELRFIRQELNGSAVGHLYIVPALNAYRGNWPSIRLWEYDELTGDIVDYIQLAVNMTVASGDTPRVDLVQTYSARKAYGITDLSTKSWENIIGLGATKQAVSQYNRLKQAQPEAENAECNDKCMRNTLCEVNYGISSLEKQCKLA